MGRSSAHHVSVAQQLFPSCLCSAVLTIIHLLDDPAVTPDGIAVYEAAQQVICFILIHSCYSFENTQGSHYLQRTYPQNSLGTLYSMFLRKSDELQKMMLKSSLLYKYIII